MKLLKYKVTNFRSVNDSGWIECDDITTLVGINESGKSNLLLALWKLNPAREGAIDVLHDLPVSKLSSLRDKLSEIVFIIAEFSFDEVTKNKIEEECNCKLSESSSVTISRKYDENYEIEFNEIEFLSNDEETEEVNCKVNQEKAKKIILDAIPCFVYYSNYGNLSSKIYLPHAITWLDGGTVSGIETNQEQVRTLKVLFEFVNLKPKEILALGRDPKVMAMERNRNSSSAPSKDEIAKAERDKEQRSILLQSASGKLTKEFKDWWKQGEYKFRFEADGDYFRIWVSDEKRPDEVGLELRSTGLQWFISFYLIFLVESQNNHKNSVLLLDEAGLTLHPLAQKDLYKFFDNLSINIEKYNNFYEAIGNNRHIIIKDDKINKLSYNTLDVDLEIEREITKKFDNIPIKVLNKADNKKVSFVGDNKYASVSITGAESIVSAIAADNIQASIDVNNLNVGSKKVNVSVAVDNEQLSIKLLSSKQITVNIERK